MMWKARIIDLNLFVFQGHRSIAFIIKIAIAIACIFCFYIQPAYFLAAKDVSEPLENAKPTVDLADILDRSEYRDAGGTW